MSHMLDVRWRHRWRDITPGVGQLFLGESLSPVSIRICVPNLVAVRQSCQKKGGVQTDRQTARQRDTAALYSIVHVFVKVNNEELIFNAIPFDNSYYFIS